MPYRIVSVTWLLLALPIAGQAADPANWSLGLVSQRYSGSHTSYEFGNPLPPNQAPLSRLEFPMNAWFGGFALNGQFDRFSVSGEILRNLSNTSRGRFKDSDWSGEDYEPSVLDIYSESSMRIKPSYMGRLDADLRIDDWVDLPNGFDLRPVVGVRWQELNFVSYNGIQSYPATSGKIAEPLPGDGIAFRQTLWQYFLGARMAYDLGRHTALPGMKLTGQLDWARVSGHNADHHLLRSGNRWTYEDTLGDAWHAVVGLSAPLSKDLNLGLSFEYLRLQSTGTHRMINSDPAVDIGWNDGVKVWSEQKNVRLNLQFVF